MPGTKKRRKKKIGPRTGGRPRRVLLQPHRPVDERGKSLRWDGQSGSFSAWEASRIRALQSSFRTYPIARLTEDGIDWGVNPGPGDEIGYGMHPYLTDDCLEAAIATTTQVPIEQVPNFALLERRDRGEDPDEITRSTWERIGQWAFKRGLVLTFWDEPPAPRDRWIGVVPSSAEETMVLEGGRITRSDSEGGFNDHCLVMSGSELVFDPACGIRLPPGMRTQIYKTTEITYGISFDKEE